MMVVRVARRWKEMNSVPALMSEQGRQATWVEPVVRSALGSTNSFSLRLGEGLLFNWLAWLFSVFPQVPRCVAHLRWSILGSARRVLTHHRRSRLHRRS